MDFDRYEKYIREMGVKSGAYRDLNLNFFNYNDQSYHISEFYNLLRDTSDSRNLEPLRINEAFSATIAYLGTYLHRSGFTFDYINSFQDDKEALAEKLENQDILTIAITTTYYVFVLPLLEIIEFIRARNRKAKIIIGGPYIATQVRTQDAAAVEYMFKSVMDADIYVNSAQGETALVNILKSLKQNRSLEEVPNIHYRSGDRVVATPVARENNRIEENYVDWSLFEPQRVGRYLNLRTAISCPFSCAFCGFPEHAGAYQTMSVEILEKELNAIKGLGTPIGFNVIDDTYNVPIKRFKELLRMMIRNNYGFKWIANFRCQFIDVEMVELMKASGCEGVFLGIESGSDRILKNMNKVASVEKYREGIALLKKFGISTFGSFIVGFPGETDATVQESLDFIQQSGIDFYRTHLWYCDPITPIFLQKEQYKLEGESFEWRHATMDAAYAGDWIEKIYLNARNATWVPQYNFDFDNLWHLMHRGFSLQQIHRFIGIFNDGIKEKLRDPSRREVSADIIKGFKDFCGNVDGLDPGKLDNQMEITEDFGVDFSF